MTFKELSVFFEKLETTSSRNSMVEILAALFKEASADESEKIAYLTQGRVAPMFEPVEFGMADKMVARAIAQANGIELEQVVKEFKKNGDLGVVTQKLHRSRRGDRGLRVSEAFERLQEITQIAGEGSVEKKVFLLCELLKSVDGLSSRYLARIPLGNLRLGFSDMTVLDAFSWMIDGDKKHKTSIESAYNIRPDLGFIAKTLKKEGMEGLKHVKPKLGTPILVMRAERLTTASEILEKGGGQVAVEPKVDGFRLQLHFKKGVTEIIEKSADVKEKEKENLKEVKDEKERKKVAVELFSRGLEHVTSMYPDIVEAAVKEVDSQEVILDGEAIAFNPKTGKFLPFQETVQRKRKYDIDKFALDLPLKLIVFDCLFLDGESILDKPYKVRREIVEKLLKGNKTIVPAEMEIVSDPQLLEKRFDETLKKGLEGIMAKKLDGVYQAGARGWNWIKLKGSYTGKLSDTVDAVVMGLDYGQGARTKFGVGSFLVGVYDQKNDSFKTISKIGTGLTDEEWKELKAKSSKLTAKEKPSRYEVNKIMNCDVWIKPELVGEFRSDELTISPMHTAGYAMRFPRLIRWREKKAQDATSVEEIHKMFKLQKK